jgi:hypothetical protein
VVGVVGFAAVFAGPFVDHSTLSVSLVVVLVVKGKLTVWSAWVVWSECGEVVHFAIHHYPAVVWFGVLVELGDGDLCV